MVRNILAVVVAFVVAGCFVVGVEALGHVVYPIPEGLDTTDFKQLADYVKVAPIGALLFVLLAQSCGSFAGGFITRVVGGSSYGRLALIYGVLALTMAAINVLLIPHPLWMTVLALALPIPLSWVGSLTALGIGFGKKSSAIQ